MAIVALRPPLRELAGGRREVVVRGTTVAEALACLERDHPRLAGWVLDERGRVRRHVAVFVGGERVDGEAPLDPDARIDVVGSVSGGAGDAEVLVGTRKGLFVLRGERGGPMEVAARAFPGMAVEYAIRDPRSGTYLASVTHGQFGPHVFLAEDPTGEWEQSSGPAFPDGEDASLERVWKIEPGVEDGVLFAGVDPAALFESRDGGRTWSLNRGLWDQPSRPSEWTPGLGGLALHSICPWPGDPLRLAVGISAVGVWLTEDAGRTWRVCNDGLVPRYLPEEARARPYGRCVHSMHRSPVRPERMFMQFHGGVYRSDDAGATWTDVGAGLPSDFGFPLVVDATDADAAYVIPLNSDRDRVTAEGRVRVYETRDAGATWSARSAGLPADGFLTVLRQAFDHDEGGPPGLYFGATSGQVFGSADGGANWAPVVEDIAPVLSVRVSR
jgi:molybdopterin converting factor small subunit